MYNFIEEVHEGDDIFLFLLLEFYDTCQYFLYYLIHGELRDELPSQMLIMPLGPLPLIFSYLQIEFLGKTPYLLACLKGGESIRLDSRF